MITSINEFDMQFVIGTHKKKIIIAMYKDLTSCFDVLHVNKNSYRTLYLEMFTT